MIDPSLYAGMFWSIAALLFLICCMCAVLVLVAFSLRVAIKFLLGQPVHPLLHDHVKQDNSYHGYSGKLD